MNQQTDEPLPLAELSDPSAVNNSIDSAPGDSPELLEPSADGDETRALVKRSPSDLASTHQALDQTVPNSQSVVGATVQKAAEALSYVSSSVAAVGSTIVAQVMSSAKQYADADREQWFGDDVERLRQECDLLNEWNQTRFPSQVIQSALYAAAAVGVLTNQTAIIHMTRKMDSKQAWVQILFRHLFNPEAAEEISDWMDKVPGWKVKGGMFHRLAHGHDIGALVELVRQHNVTGAIEWFNHVALRDFWTPHGVPFLPVGSRTAFDWLVSSGVKKTTAMRLLSINAAHVTGALLAYQAGKSTINYIEQQLRERKAQQLWSRAQDLESMNDYESADICYDQALGYASDVPEALIWVAIRALNRAQKAEDSKLWQRHNQRCYQLAGAVRLKLATEDKLIPFSGGTQVSLRGLAVTLMAVSWAGSAGEKELAFEGHRGIISGAINDLLTAAEALRAGVQMPVLGGTLAGARPFSAILNESLALNLFLSSPEQLPTPHTPITIHKRITDTLQDVVSRNNQQSAYAQEIFEGFMRKYPLSNQD